MKWLTIRLLVLPWWLEQPETKWSVAVDARNGRKEGSLTKEGRKIEGLSMMTHSSGTGREATLKKPFSSAIKQRLITANLSDYLDLQASTDATVISGDCPNFGCLLHLWCNNRCSLRRALFCRWIDSCLSLDGHSTCKVDGFRVCLRQTAGLLPFDKLCAILRALENATYLGEHRPVQEYRPGRKVNISAEHCRALKGLNQTAFKHSWCTSCMCGNMQTLVMQ